MCCLFGLLDYGGKLTYKKKQKILRVLSVACEARGTDAAGLAWFGRDGLHIQKAPGAARTMQFRFGPESRFLMGHTRMTTQGNARFNRNNHPFFGRCGSTEFALAHNGVLTNYHELKVEHRLPKTKIETDSYVAVQLLEQESELNFNSLGWMAEQLHGSFTLTALDREGLYIVVGDNPFCMYHFENAGFYLYASTEAILSAAVKALGLNRRSYDTIEPEQGTILRVVLNGAVTEGTFNDENLRWKYSSPFFWQESVSIRQKRPRQTYLEQVIQYGISMGIPENSLWMLAEEGYTAMELEELIYDEEFLNDCLAEVGFQGRY